VCAAIATVASGWNAFRAYQNRSHVVNECSLVYDGLRVFETKLCERIFDSCVRPVADLNYGIHAHELYL